MGGPPGRQDLLLSRHGPLVEKSAWGLIFRPGFWPLGPGPSRRQDCYCPGTGPWSKNQALLPLDFSPRLLALRARALPSTDCYCPGTGPWSKNQAEATLDFSTRLMALRA